jgi:hypothetical protein
MEQSRHSGQFDKETSCKNFEWHRERVLREKKTGVTPIGANRVDWLVRNVQKTHGAKAARELQRELRSK